MGARFAGIGIGNLDMKSACPDTIEVLAEIEAETCSSISLLTSTDQSLRAQADTEPEITTPDDPPAGDDGNDGNDGDEFDLVAFYEDDGDI